MNTRAKIAIFFLFAAVATAPQLPGRQRSEFLESFAYAGRTYSLDAEFSPGRADLVLSQGRRTVNLSAGMAGENILLGTRAGGANFYVFWLNYRQKTKRLAYYDHNRQRSRLLPLAGFSSFGLPQVLETNGALQSLVFLGNNSDNVDIFHYGLAAGELTPLTRTRFSEKEIVLQETDNGMVIETRSLRARYRYDFDRQTRQSRLLDEERFSPAQKTEKLTAAVTPEYYNTYIGFGDSITAGQIEQVVHPELCYLTVMKEMLALTYGPAFPINLGVPANGTLDGAQRVDADLEANSAFYFLLMLGVNDVWNKELFDLSDSLENLSYIMDAALAKHMRVIVSTLTPRKDDKADYQYYWDNLNALSAGILDLAVQKGTASIDTLSAFMNTNPPDGWKDLLERRMTVIVDGLPVLSKGNHPNAAGQRLIATLFSPALAAFPPLPAQNITVLNPQDRLQRNVQWDPGYESDLDHYHIEFGFKPQALDYSLDNAASHYTFNLFPFLPQVYFRIQAVDRGGNTSVFSDEKASPAASPQIKIRK